MTLVKMCPAHRVEIDYCVGIPVVRVHRMTRSGEPLYKVNRYYAPAGRHIASLLHLMQARDGHGWQYEFRGNTYGCTHNWYAEGYEHPYLGMRPHSYQRARLFHKGGNTMSRIEVMIREPCEECGGEGVLQALICDKCGNQFDWEEIIPGQPLPCGHVFDSLIEEVVCWKCNGEEAEPKLISLTELLKMMAEAK